jgi:hypothetical protein
VTDEALMAAFEAGRMPEGGFHHAEHVRVGWIYLGRHPTIEALRQFVTNLKRFAAAQGTPDRYHETITFAFLLMIQDRIARRGRGTSWDAFASANADLLTWNPSVLDRYYSQALLASATARGAFVWPDCPE